jgi:multisubunit Na+/H+ antiporter MnhE subunit
MLTIKMRMHLELSTRRAWMALLLIVGVAFAVFVVRTVAYLNGPPDGDLYAWNWGFQLVMFAIFWLPLLVACWAVSVVLAWAVRR